MMVARMLRDFVMRNSDHRSLSSVRTALLLMVSQNLSDIVVEFQLLLKHERMISTSSLAVYLHMASLGFAPSLVQTTSRKELRKLTERWHVRYVIRKVEVTTKNIDSACGHGAHLDTCVVMHSSRDTG